MTTAPESEREETLRCLSVFARIMLCDLIDFWLIEPHFTFGINDVFRVWRRNVDCCLGFFTSPPEINLTLLRVGFIHYFLILLPDQVGLSGAKVCGRGIHLSQYRFQTALAVGGAFSFRSGAVTGWSSR